MYECARCERSYCGSPDKGKICDSCWVSVHVFGAADKTQTPLPISTRTRRFARLRDAGWILAAAALVALSLVALRKVQDKPVQIDTENVSK